MGYRSDVAIAIHKDLQGDFLTFLNTTELMAEIFGDMSDFHLDKDYQDSGHWLFICNGVKWYSSYKDIEMFEKFFNAMDEDDDYQEKYRFLRIGEEIEDIEYRGDWHDSEIYVSREIQVGY